MSAPHCPSCNAELPPQEVADGWCENCGKKVLTWIRGHSPLPPSTDFRDSIAPNPFRLSLAAEPASRLSRLAAAIIDTVLVWVAMAPGLIVSYSLEEANDPSLELVSMLSLLAGMGLIGLVQMVLLTIRGQTVGKLLLRIRIVNFKDGSNPGFFEAVLLRSVLPGLISSCVGLFALVDILFIFAEDRRCLHDHIAGTQVVLA